MHNIITCKKCGNQIEISEALSHQIEEQVVRSLEAKHKDELATATKIAEEIAHKKISETFSQQLDTLQKENNEEKEHSKELRKKLDDMLDEMRSLKRKDEERDIEMKKKMMDEEERIIKDARQKSEEEHQLKDLEKEKKLQDALKQIDDLKTRMQQGSQQMQGEVIELELERVLKTEFPIDNISEVKKGQYGADVVEVVVDKLGRTCGTVMWECKNAKWGNDWIQKLKDDQRAKKAELAVLVVINKPEWLRSFTYRDGVWVVEWQSVVPLAFALRYNLINLKFEKALFEGKDEKSEVLYTYLTGLEFKHRIEAILEAFTAMQSELDKEKNWFAHKWNRQEKQIRKVLDNTYGMHGELQGILGKSLPELKDMADEEQQLLEAE